MNSTDPTKNAPFKLTLSPDQNDAVGAFMSFLLDKDEKELVITGSAGCVDKDTEYLTPTGWVPIHEYKRNTPILQWSFDGTTEFIIPSNFIKLPAKELIHIKSNTIDMMISPEHRMPFITSKGHFSTQTAERVITKSTVKIPRNFSAPILPGIPLSNAEIKVLIMQTADGSILPTKQFKIAINVKKSRKKRRVEQNLTNAGIPYTITKGTPGYTRYSYYPPVNIRMKNLAILWGCSKKQLQIAYKELIKWDSSVHKRKNVTTYSFTGNKQDAEIYQYIYSTVSGKYTTVALDKRKYKKENLFNVRQSSRSTSTLEFIKKGKKQLITIKPTLDGFKYCFTTPSSYWLARRNGKIFPTGNSGKTFLTRHLLKVAREEQHMLDLLTDNYKNLNVILASTTNKAASVLSDSTGEEVRTIHSVLGLRVINDFKTGKTKLKKSKDSAVIENSLIFIDEASMIDGDLLKEIRNSTLDCKIVYIGDANQLAPIFETTCPVFTQISNVSRLTTIQRQAADSPIIEYAYTYIHALNTGEFSKEVPNHPDIQLVDGDGFRKAIHDTFTESWGVNHGRVVAWTNERVHQYNGYIRSLYTDSSDYQIGEHLLTNNPIVINNKIIASTDSIHKITDIYPTTLHHIDGWNISLGGSPYVFLARNQEEVKQHIKRLAAIKAWPAYFEAKEQFNDLRPIYANTVNKAQGSTYDTVLIDLDDIGKNRKNDQIARLMYVACTRAKYKVIMTGKLPARLYK